MKKLVPLFIFLFMLTNGYTQIKKWNNVTKLTNETSANYFKLNRTISNKKFRIANNFFINTDIRFSNCIFYMDSFSSIIVMNNCKVTFDSCSLLACDTIMWKGFTILPTATLNLNDSKIYDADTAIVCRKNGVFHINSATMNRNLVGISVYPNLISANTSSIYHSQMYCHNDIYPVYGNVTPPSDGTLRFPNRNQKTHFGIYVRDNILLNIGDTITGLDLRNKFEDMYDGIYSKYTNLRVINCDFKKMRSLGPISGGTYSYGSGIEFRTNNNGASLPTKLYVYHCMMDTLDNAGIYLFGTKQNDTIEFNTINKVKFGIYATGLGNQSTSSGVPVGYTSTIIRYNTIYYGNDLLPATHTAYAGIKLNAISKVFAIVRFNKITSLASLINSNETGIFASSVTNSNKSPKLVINNNKIINGKNGIHMLSIYKPFETTYFENQIQNDSMFSLDTKKNYCGIFMQNANDFSIGNNYIKGKLLDTLNSLSQQGISLNASKDNRIFCNRMDKLYYGLYYTGDCLMKHRLYGNNFDTLIYHIFGKNPSSLINAKLGDQNHVDDGTMAGLTQFPANKMNNKAYRNAIFNEDSITGLISWDRRLAAIYNPASPLTSSSIPVGVYFNLATNIDYLCPIFVSSGGTSGGLLMEDTIDESQTLYTSAKQTAQIIDEESQGAKQMSEEYIYDKLKNAPELLLVNDSLQAYYEEQQTEYIGDLDEIKVAMSDGAYELAEEKLNEIIATEYQQEADKIVYTILKDVEQREDYVLTETELNELLIVAAYCPIRHGSAVYLARTIINSQAGYEYRAWNDDELCIKGITYRRANLVTTEKETNNNKINIYPNPTNQILYFDISDKNDSACNEIKNYSIKTINGKIIINKQYRESVKNGNIDISNYVDGIYIIEFVCKDNSFTNFKFIIQK